MYKTIQSKPVPLGVCGVCQSLSGRFRSIERSEKLGPELDTAANQCCISLSKMDEAEAKQGSDRSTATRVVLRSCRRKTSSNPKILSTQKLLNKKIDRIAICHSSEDGCSATKMSQTSRGSAISNRIIGRCMHERWLQFLPVGNKKNQLLYTGLGLLKFKN